MAQYELKQDQCGFVNKEFMNSNAKRTLSRLLLGSRLQRKLGREWTHGVVKAEEESVLEAKLKAQMEGLVAEIREKDARIQQLQSCTKRNDNEAASAYQLLQDCHAERRREYESVNEQYVKTLLATIDELQEQNCTLIMQMSGMESERDAAVAKSKEADEHKQIAETLKQVVESTASHVAVVHQSEAALKAQVEQEKRAAQALRDDLTFMRVRWQKKEQDWTQAELTIEKLHKTIQENDAAAKAAAKLELDNSMYEVQIKRTNLLHADQLKSMEAVHAALTARSEKALQQQREKAVTQMAEMEAKCNVALTRAQVEHEHAMAALKAELAKQLEDITDAKESEEYEIVDC
eukprot:TRINITY_DN13945_c0_g1_i1.p1 TRINITY_DN13945_c0_g1~~TRINITY_DN13945_c0_g1_i1.p1  ORF type:complete len:394 (+),score=131.20 TRINITY_DN13945_c0_g1_i1:136-1182(+)